MRARAVLLSLCVIGTTSFAFAGDNKADSDKLFMEGLHLFEQKDFAGARQKFSDAYGKYPSPNSLLNLARSEQLSNRCVEAIMHYRAYIALPDNPRIGAGDRGSARLKLGECLAKIGRIQVDAPARAKVTIDGLAATWRPGETLDVAPGEHKIEISVDGDTKTRMTSPLEGGVSSVQWEDPPPPPPPPIVVVPPPPPPPIETKPPDPVVVTPPPPPETKPPVWKTESHWPAAKLGVAVSLGVAGIVSFIVAPSLLVVSLGAADDADKLSTKLGSSGCTNASTNPDCIQLANDRTQQGNFAAASALFWIFGPLCAAGAIVAVAAWPNVHPLVSATSNGFSIRF